MANQLPLMEGETVVATLETEMYATSSNIIANIFAKIEGVFDALIGAKRRGQLTITDRRLILEQHKKIFWCFDTEATFCTMMPSSIANVNYGFKSQVLCCCRKYVFEIVPASGDGLSFVLKGGKNQAAEIANAAVHALLAVR